MTTMNKRDKKEIIGLTILMILALACLVAGVIQESKYDKAKAIYEQARLR